MIIRKAGPGDAAGIARVHIDTWRVTYRDIIPEDFLSRMSYERRQENWKEWLGPQSHTLAYVSEDQSHGIIGFAAGGPELTNDQDYKSELYAIYVSEKMQRMGIGRGLLRFVVNYLKAIGFDSMIAWCSPRILRGNSMKQLEENISGQRK